MHCKQQRFSSAMRNRHTQQHALIQRVCFEHTYVQIPDIHYTQHCTTTICKTNAPFCRSRKTPAAFSCTSTNSDRLDSVPSRVQQFRQQLIWLIQLHDTNVVQKALYGLCVCVVMYWIVTEYSKQTKRWETVIAQTDKQPFRFKYKHRLMDARFVFADVGRFETTANRRVWMIRYLWWYVIPTVVYVVCAYMYIFIYMFYRNQHTL